jgi:hypothetical protein
LGCTGKQTLQAGRLMRANASQSRRTSRRRTRVHQLPCPRLSSSGRPTLGAWACPCRQVKHRLAVRAEHGLGAEQRADTSEPDKPTDVCRSPATRTPAPGRRRRAVRLAQHHAVRRAGHGVAAAGHRLRRRHDHHKRHCRNLPAGRCILVVGMHGQIVITGPIKTCIRRCPRLVPGFAQHHRYRYIDVVIADEAKDHATASVRTASTSAAASTGNARRMSSTERPAAR